MDPEEFQIASTDEGRDVSEGEIAYRIEARNGGFVVIEHLASDPTDLGNVLEIADTRADAERLVREYLAIHSSPEEEED